MSLSQSKVSPQFKILFGLIACSLSLAFVTAGFAQDESATDPSIEQYKTAKKNFDDLTAKARELSEKYRVAEAEDQAAISAQYNELAGTLDSAYQAFRDSAIAAYKTNKDGAEELENDVVRLAATEVSLENYHFAYDVVKMLKDAGCESKDLPAVAGMAAFGTNRFEAAKAFWDDAKANNAMSPEFNRYVGMLPGLIENFKKEEEIRKAEAAADDLPRVLVKTNKGDITIELFENEAPEAVGNFVSLVEKGFYDGLTFHRVLPNFMAQGGCPDGSGTGGPGYRIYCETERPDYRHHFAGTLSMAHAGKNTGGSQFFLTFVPTPHLDGAHTAFGRVIDGWDVLSKLQRIDPRRPVAEPDVMESVTVIRKRDHEYVPNKVEN